MTRGVRYNPYVTPQSSTRRGQIRGGQIRLKNSSSGSSSGSSVKSRLSSLLSAMSDGSKSKTRTKKHYAVSKRPWVDTHGKRPIYTSKKKVMNRELKGSMRKFQKKVMKVIEHVKNYGEYIYIGDQQLKQGVLDRYGLFPVDAQGVPIVIGSDRALSDAAAVCFNAKAAALDYQVTTGNFASNNKINLISESLSFFFKSTSSHVVNIQMFEFISKINQDDSPETLIAESLDDFSNSLKATQNTSQTGAFGFDMLGSEARHLPSVFQKYSVKVHSFKLPPGETASKNFKRGSRTFDPVKAKNGSEQPYLYRKGCSYFYFRVLNDITVSGVSELESGSASRVHHWPSNRQGGVALEYKRTIKLMPPPSTAAASDRPVVVIGCMKYGSSSLYTDQQVAVENPVVKATAD